ncbi:MAG: ABC transporter permease subunit [Celeribacter sp.]|jgi:general L-amino acid transport system permease protein
MTLDSASSPLGSAPRRSPPRKQAFRLNGMWHDRRARGVVAQVAVISVLLGLGYHVVANAQSALAQRGIETGFGFLFQKAGFAIGESPIPYDASDTYLRAYAVGVLNTLKVSIAAIVLASILGLMIGVARLSSNLIVNRLASAYVELFRNTPQLLQIVFWYILAVALPGPKQAFDLGGLAFLSNRGLSMPGPGENARIWLVAIGLIIAVVLVRMLTRHAARKLRETGTQTPVLVPAVLLLLGCPAVLWLLFGQPADIEIPRLQGFNIRGGLQMSPEFLALFLGLSLYIAAFIAEIVRAGILAVDRGQIEAAEAMGLRHSDVLRRVTLPQALRVIVPPATAQYVSLIKNSSLGVLIGYPELFNLNNTILVSSGNTLEAIAIMMAIYLSITASVALLMNLYNASVQLKER